ncbi:MAG: hypothetical protein AAF970_02435, partial [Bacteroidota bacterium]
MPSPASGQAADLPQIMVDNFEGETPGAWPSNWRFLSSKDQRFRSLDRYMADDEKFYIEQEGGNSFLRAYTASEAQRITMGNDEDFGLDWRFDAHARIAWDWRARKL